jgi:hypothetical protein
MDEVKFTLGSDPELFLRHATTKELRSAIPIIPEGKNNGRWLDGRGLNRVLHDNVLVEVNTAPATSEDAFVKTIGEVLKKTQNIVKQHGLELHLQASAEFPLTELDSEEARTFGCDPDFGSYPPGQNIMSATAAFKPFRSAGGHLHIGKHNENPALNELLDEESGLGKVIVVKTLDIFIGIIGVFLDKDTTAKARRELYGKAGSHRPKDYGVEYRACSPWWLESPEHTKLVYQLVAAALKVAVEEDVLAELHEAIGGETAVQEIVDEAKTEEARCVYEEILCEYLSEEVQAKIEALDAQERTELAVSWNL